MAVEVAVEVMRAGVTSGFSLVALVGAVTVFLGVLIGVFENIAGKG